MGSKRSTFEKILVRFIAISCVIGLFVASVIIMSNQRLPSRAYEFVRSLAEGDDVLASEKSENDIDSEFDYDDPRLPGDVLPKAYDLSIAVNLSTLTFSGEVDINVLCERSTQHIILHSKDINILQTNVSSFKKRKEVKIDKILTKPKYDHYIIELRETLKKRRKYVIRMKYEANISKTLDGFYKSYYTTGLGERRPLLVTHFEPMSARKAFPCFDEPAMKANFTLHISRDPTHQSLSNMPRDHEENKAIDVVVDHYLTTPPMSSYLVSFMVLDFAYQETKTATGVKVRVYAPPEDKNKLSYALNIASKTLTFYEKLLGIPFPLKKLDLVAVPDFSRLGMEEWGIISLRRDLLIYDEKFTTAMKKLKQLEFITHELAHMWFGDLVTMKWWDDIWLKESFVTFFSYLARYNIDKETDSLAMSVLFSWQKALKKDGNANIHSLITSVKAPAETEKLFDTISYHKGAMILKMLMNTLGNSAFLKGLRMYIDEKKYGNSETCDLWHSLSKIMEKGLDRKLEAILPKPETMFAQLAMVGKRLNLTLLMKTWTDQNSFPIVTLKRLKGPEKDIILAKQESFLEHKLPHRDVTDTKIFQNTTADQIDRIGKKQQVSSRPWHIPLTYIVQSTAFKEYTVWLDKKWEKLSVLDPKGWIKANVRANGYYIVNYDKANWIKLIKQLKNYHVVFSPSDRAGLIHDAFILACEGILEASIPLKLIMYMAKEEHFVPMEMLRQKSSCLEEHFKEENVKKLYKDYLWYLQEHLLKKLGMEDKGGILEQLNRRNTISYAMEFRPDIKQKFVKIFEELRKSKGQSLQGLSSNFRELAFTYGADTSSVKDWEYLWKVYETSPFDSDRSILRDILKSYDRDDLFAKNLEYSLDPRKIREQDFFSWLSDMNTEKHKEQMWRFLKNNWNTLKERLGKNEKLATLVHDVVVGVNTAAHYNEVKQFLHSDAAWLMDDKLRQSTLDGIREPGKKVVDEKKIDVTKASKWLQRYMKKIKQKAQKKTEIKELVQTAKAQSK